MKNFWMIAILLCLSLTGCAKQPKNEYQISQDLTLQNVLPCDDTVRITNLQVLQRQTNPDTRHDLVFVQVDGEFRELDYSRQYKMTYEFFDEGGWVLQSLEPHNTNDWTIQCPDQNCLKADLETPAALGLDGFSVTDVTLKDAVPDADLHACTLSAVVYGHNAYANATFPLTVRYSMTSNGWEWLQAEIDHDQAVVVPFAGISEKTALEDANAHFSYAGTYTVSDSQDNYDEFQQVLYLQNHSNGNYLNMIRDVQLVYTFDPIQMCWVLDSCDTLNTSCQLRFTTALSCSGSESDVIGELSCDLTMDLGALEGTYLQRGVDFLDDLLD